MSEERVANDFAFRIIDGGHEILIFPDGQVTGWPKIRKYATPQMSGMPPDSFVIDNRVPALVSAAENIGYVLGLTEAKAAADAEALSKAHVIINNKVPDEEVRDESRKTPD